MLRLKVRIKRPSDLSEFVPLKCFDIREGKYLINKKGEIYGVYRDRLMSYHKDKDGYCIINLETNKRLDKNSRKSYASKKFQSA